MFLGHHAVAFAARRADPRLSLGILVLAATLVDLFWPIFLLLGLERVEIEPGNTAFTPLNFTHYPITHSVPGTLAWATTLALLWYSRNKAARAAAVVGAVVFSHWILDVISHRPDMPVMPGGPYVGLGLWYSVPATLLVEGMLFAGGILLYVRGTRARDVAGRWSLVSLVVFLTVVYAAAAFGPPPPSERAIAYGALAAWLFVPWAYWIDRHRELAAASSSR
jgi:membrane-bound metal-dependent hydrolase YbcI (DUF457 family)